MRTIKSLFCVRSIRIMVFLDRVNKAWLSIRERGFFTRSLNVQSFNKIKQKTTFHKTKFIKIATDQT